ncbi:hypothetical protein [Streptomyces chartreusis]|uniref:hypothetical protein n=1 Tax=Streptomyces chartreusis TaxID=1969 RepID=UPI0033D691F2
MSQLGAAEGLPRGVEEVAAGADAVRTIRVLPIGAAPAPHATEPAPSVAAAPEAPVKTRETASAGYREALAAHQVVANPSCIDRSIAEAVERQTKVLRELSRRAFPEPEPDPDGGPAPLDAVRAQRRRDFEATRALALRLALVHAYAASVTREASSSSGGLNAVFG